MIYFQVSIIKLIIGIIVIDILTIITVWSNHNGFSVYWNAPTESCRKYKIDFTNLTRFGIIQNKDDTFKGENITILYDPGYFPAIIDGKFRNGGVPQEGNLNEHLKKFKNAILESIPNPDFKGISVIDFEEWRPIFNENWSKLDIYRTTSYNIEKKKHPLLNKTTIMKMAKNRWEESAFKFINETLSLAIKLRPKGKWGYYAFPYCFNYSPNNKECTKSVIADNNRSTWMFKTGTAVYPSLYLYEKNLVEEKRAMLMKYRTIEGKRIAEKGLPQLKVLPYVTYKYPDTHAFYSKTDMKNSIFVQLQAGADGIIIWGSSKDVSTKKDCFQLQDYANEVIGPLVMSLNQKGIVP